MPTTPSGTAYTTTRIDLGAPHGVMNITVADAMVGQPLRMCLYGHGANGLDDQMASHPAWRQMLNSLMDNTENPLVVVEGSGGSAFGNLNWGNPDGQNAYRAYDNYASDIYEIAGRFLLGRSMGEFVMSNLYAKDEVERYAGLINNSGVSTAFAGTLTGDKEEDAATGWYFSPSIWQAWGATDVASLETALRANDAIPEEWPGSRFVGKNILWVYGTSDMTVPWDTRGGEAVRALWGDNLEIDRVVVNSGGHPAPGSYAEVPAMLTFIADIFGDAPTPPQPPMIERITEAFIIEDGQRHTVYF